MWKIAFCLIGLVLLASLTSAKTQASVGVGVGTGKIEVKEEIKSGSIYTLPPITVFNTGTEDASYTMEVTLNETQPQLKPNPNWFSFSPQEFSLSPGKSQLVTPTFHPPLVTQPGDYFGYLEAHPSETVQQGGATIGVAAATKLSFTVIPSNIFIAILYRILAIFQSYAPWSYIAVIMAVVGSVILILRRRLHFNLRITKKK